MQPGLFGERFYGMTTFISVGLFVGAAICLTYVIGSRYIKGNRYHWISVCILYVFTSVQCMPDGNEGLYWHAGGANYTWGYAFLLFLTACVLFLYKEGSKKKWLQMALACILAVLVGGGNYITALQGCIWLVLLDIVMLYNDTHVKKDSYGKILKKNASVIIPTLTIIIAFLASVLAPGNQVRMGMSKGMEPAEAVLESFRYTLTMPLEDWLHWPVWILLAMSVPFMWNIIKTQSFTFPCPGIVILLGYCLTAAGFTPSLYAQGMVQAGRLQDTVYYILILMLYVSVFYVTGWLYHKKKKQQRQKNSVQEKQELSVLAKECILVLFLVWGVGSVFHMTYSTELYVGTDAAYAIVSGQAESYRQENEKRVELLESTEENVILPKFTNAPELLQFEDISPNPGEWLNTAMAEYYGKESVKREE